MFKSSDFDLLIETVDSGIKHYSDVFIIEKKEFDAKTDNLSFITNERTISSLINQLSLDYLTKNGFNVLLYVNEFGIKVTNRLSVKAIETIETEVSAPSCSNEWKKCYIDGYFKIKDLIVDETVTHVFVEYKMNNSFVYLDLAKDFLKYKTYTYKDESNTVFVYAICEKKEDYPSILNSARPRFEILDKNIDELSISKDQRVFVYIGNNDGPDVDSPDSIDEASKKMDDLVDSAEKVLEAIEIDKDNLSNDKKVFIEYLHFYNSKIVKSKTIQKYYYFIKEVWDESNNKKIFDNLPYLFNVSEDKITSNLIIGTGKFYRDNLAEFLSANDKVVATENGINGSINTSLFIVSVIDYFNDTFEVGVNKPEYGKKTFRRGREIIEHKWQKTVNHFKELLKNNWNNSPEKAKKLAFSLMYFLVNAYPILFELDKNNKVLGPNTQYKTYSAIEELQTKMKNTMKWFKCPKDFFVDVNDLIDKDEDAIDKLINFLKFIVKKF